MDDEIDLIRNYVETTLRASGSHGFDHILRVTRLCEAIGRVEGADMRVLIPAALFHDIARPLEEERGFSHEEEGARIAEDYLRSVRYDTDRIPLIAHAIRTHRYRSTATPETLEAKILSDADKLDALGAVGIARTFLRAGEHGGGIQDAVDHIGDKLLKLKGLMYTDGARQIAEERHELLTRFVENLDEEMHVGGRCR
ncbi:HD domain-containing protein [Methanofollis formosanus]|uniref:HD domain-containing protein n=2 Tax=Methanofollis formosanus TaxID=299308 RepID=A0A8G1A3L5_9EURY|nr:HD domain-containing protein [Methanofollis formosanus]QYZ80436.1 HD domain-containing protein [Methanofollis formosanus]